MVKLFDNLTACINGDGNPLAPGSKVLCSECLAELDTKWQDVKREEARETEIRGS